MPRFLDGPAAILLYVILAFVALGFLALGTLSVLAVCALGFVTRQPGFGLKRRATRASLG